jgi:hypothetical protein
MTLRPSSTRVIGWSPASPRRWSFLASRAGAEDVPADRAGAEDVLTDRAGAEDVLTDRAGAEDVLTGRDGSAVARADGVRPGTGAGVGCAALVRAASVIRRAGSCA